MTKHADKFDTGAAKEQLLDSLKVALGEAEDFLRSASAFYHSCVCLVVRLLFCSWR